MLNPLPSTAIRANRKKMGLKKRDWSNFENGTKALKGIRTIAHVDFSIHRGMRMCGREIQQEAQNSPPSSSGGWVCLRLQGIAGLEGNLPCPFREPELSV